MPGLKEETIMPEDDVSNEIQLTDEQKLHDMHASHYFLSLKRNYELQRQPWEQRWDQAQAAYHLTDDLDEVYNGRANIQVPVMKWKVNGLAARINRILFNTEPIGRMESAKISLKDKQDIVDLHSKYIFDYQLGNINFKESFKSFIKNKTIEGTSVAKVSQEFEERAVSYFGEEEPELTVVKDDTFFRNILLKEFYSDVNKENINDSQACIHSTAVALTDLLANELRIEIEEVDDGVEIVEDRTQVGVYRNLHLLTMDGEGITAQQADYIQRLGLNKGQTVEFERSLKETRKTGFVQIDECYGKYDLDGDGIPEEVICTIANGRVVIRLEPTPFKHKRYVRPFIVGRYEPIANCLYGNSNVISGKNLLMELNAARAQATDARTRSVANMWYQDETKNVRWDGTWRPGGVIKGQGPNGMTPLINPNLSNVSINDSEMISRDLDQLWSLSPVQQGTSDSRMIPGTARGTAQLIAQNDMPLNDIIDNTTELELKPFIEMLFERNITFKTVEDLLVVWDEQDIQRAQITDETTMDEMLIDMNVRILGNLELSNEVAHQQGYTAFLQWASTVPPIAKRLDWQAISDKMLRSFGIKDDAEGIWLDPEAVAQIDQENQQSQVAQFQMDQGKEQRDRVQGLEEAQFLKDMDTEADIAKMSAEATIEKRSGQKIQ